MITFLVTSSFSSLLAIEIKIINPLQSRTHKKTMPIFLSLIILFSLYYIYINLYSNKSGWLQTFLNYINIFINPIKSFDFMLVYVRS